MIQLERETLHIMDDQRRIALVETRSSGDDGSPEQLIRYQLGNHLDSVSLELDGYARIISYEEYTPNGGTAYQGVRNHTEALKRYRFTGKERDAETGLNYHGARYYAPWLGRWASCDTGTPLQTLNLYRYANGNPIKFVDPSGAADELSHYAETAYHIAHGLDFSEMIASHVEAVSIVGEYNALEYELAKVHQEILSVSRSSGGRTIALSEGVAERYQTLMRRYRKLVGRAEKAGRVLSKHNAMTKQLRAPVLRKATQNLSTLMTKVTLRARNVLSMSNRGQKLLGALGIGSKLLRFSGKVAAPIAVGAFAVQGWTQMPSESSEAAKTVNAAAHGGWAVFEITHPSLIAADLLLPEPIEPSRIFSGTSTALTVAGEGVLSGEEALLLSYHKASLAGHTPWHIQFGSWMYEYIKEKGGLGTLASELSSLLETKSKNWTRRISKAFEEMPPDLQLTLTFCR